MSIEMTSNSHIQATCEGSARESQGQIISHRSLVREGCHWETDSTIELVCVNTVAFAKTRRQG